MLKPVFAFGAALAMIAFNFSDPAAASAFQCPPTARDSEGPFYKPGAPERSSVGKGYLLGGAVRSAVDCSPIPDARIEFWLAGPDAAYDDRYRATVFPDPSGDYRFESHFPPGYGSRPPHIHIRVTAEGYQPLITQHYPEEGKSQEDFNLVLIPEGESEPAA
jgi:protocatechuate 3,4-dioxygenase beta subunit